MKKQTLLKYFHKNAKKPNFKKIAWPLGLVILAMFLVFSFLPVFPTTSSNSEAIPFTELKVGDSAIELGDTKVEQEGVLGAKRVTFSGSKSLYNIVFGGGTKNKTENKSEVVMKAPVQKVIKTGTLKYQYMYCSNGTYRFFSDEQFKAPNTGFTSKSPDFCAQNNAGTKTKLASSAPGAANSNKSSSSSTVNNYPIPSCTTRTIPYGKEYRNVSWLMVGETKTYSGMNGTYFSCTGTTVQPLNEIINVGTGTAGISTESNYLAQEQARSAARQKCTNQYNSAKAQLGAAGAGSGSAMEVLNSLYSQCLNSAG